MRRIPIVLQVVVLAALCGGGAGAEEGVFEVGYSAGFFYDVDANDARAATQVWVERVIGRLGLENRSRTQIFDDLPSILAAVEAQDVDVVVMQPLEFLEIEGRALLEPILITSAGGAVTYELALLVPRRSGTSELLDLRGRRLVFGEGGSGRVPRLWMDALLLKNGLAVCDEFFGSVKELKRTSQAVLSVFFGRADACVVVRGSFATMVELNPQLEQTMTALVVSPGFLSGVVCIRRGLIETHREQIREAMLGLHTDPQGQQILTLFHMDRIMPFSRTHLSRLIFLVEEHERLAGKGAR